jgi:hypothetical protein
MIGGQDRAPKAARSETHSAQVPDRGPLLPEAFKPETAWTPEVLLSISPQNYRPNPTFRRALQP